MTLLLTRPFTDEIVVRDDADRWALMFERVLREVSWRNWLKPEISFASDTMQVSLLEVIPARDAGDVCHVCGKIVTWTDHLPPLEAGWPVRCFTDVLLPGVSAAAAAEALTRVAQAGVRRQGDAIVYSAAFIDTTGPEAV